MVSPVLALVDRNEGFAAKMGNASRYRFASYGYETQIVPQGYGKEDPERLRRTGQQYDLLGLFQTAHA